VSKVRKTVKEKVEKRGDGVSFVAAVNAVVTGNVGEEEGMTSTSASSRQRIVQRSGRTVVHSEHRAESHGEAPAEGPLDPEELREEEATELPHREGTLDRLQEEADAVAAREDDEAPAQDPDTARETGKQPER
jgi:hypothetical protein